MKKALMLLLAAALLAACAGCGGSPDEPSVFYLNFKPEQDAQWKALAAAYTEETGVPVTVVTAASGTYEQTLMSEIAKEEAPTLFQVNGPVGLANWKDYCYDLSGSAVCGELASDDFTLKEGDAVYGIAFAVESYGIIVNKALLAEAGYAMEDIVNFETLKAVAEDITARRDELGFSAFTSAGMDGTSDWRFKTHLANLPIDYEFRRDPESSIEAVRGTYLGNYKAVWDLYINNATCAPAELAAKTGADAVAEFVNGEAVFYQNGTWAYGDVASVGAENLGMLPIYIGVEGEENQGLCTGTENYWCVNGEADEEDIGATLDFMYWCATSEAGVKAMCSDMGFMTTFKSNLPAANPLVKIAEEHVAAGRSAVPWSFSAIPSDEWKNAVGSALTAYAAGTGEWSAVEAAFVDGWASEYSKTRQ